MKYWLSHAVQSVFNRAGFQIRRKDAGVSYGDPIAELTRLAGSRILQVLEIGAADGRDTMKLAKAFPQATVTAFEPLSENFEKLATAAISQPNIVAVNAAASESSGRMKFYITELADASSLLMPLRTELTFDKYMTLASETLVDVKSIDEWARDSKVNRIDIMKLDAQGAELGILKGAKQLLGRRDIGVIYSEVLFLPIYQEAPLYHDIAMYLASMGYRLHNLYNLVHNQKGELAWGDAIFVPACN